LRRASSRGNHYIIRFDGASAGNPGPAAIGALIEDERGKVIKVISETIGKATNNQAEYYALIAALEAAAKIGATSVEAYSDSELLVKHIRGEYKVRRVALKPLCQQVQQLVSRLERFTILWVPREYNQEADRLAKEALKNADKAT
jgi:ribonuclease HI